MTPIYSHARAFYRDEDGSILGYLTLAFTAIIGIVALGSEGGSWLYIHRSVQGAADAAAYSVAAAVVANSAADTTAQATAVAGSFGLISGSNGVTVEVHNPPSGACYSGTPFFTSSTAYEVIVTKTVSPLISAIWLKGDKAICGRAVAYLPNSGDCILALATSGTGVGVTKNNLNLNLCNGASTCSPDNSCGIFSNSSDANAIFMSGNNDVMTASAVAANGGVNFQGNAKTTISNPVGGAPVQPDPYAADAATWPTSGGSPQTNCGSDKKATCTSPLSPGIYTDLNITTNATMKAGTYYVSGNFTVGNNTTIDATAGVTIVLTGDTSTISVNGNHSVLNLVAPGDGALKGVAIWDVKSNIASQLGLGNNSGISVTGLIYAPKAEIDYGGNSINTPTCTQIVAQVVNFTSNSVSFTGNCGSLKHFGQVPQLVE